MHIYTLIPYTNIYTCPTLMLPIKSHLQIIKHDIYIVGTSCYIRSLCIQRTQPLFHISFPSQLYNITPPNPKHISQLKYKQVESSMLYKEVMFIHMNSHPLYKH
jgi:hypothetical protein